MNGGDGLEHPGQRIGADGSLTILIDVISEDRRTDLEQACENCPTQALSIED